MARSQPPQAPAPPPQGPPSREGSGGFCREQRGTAPGHSGRTCHQRGEPSSPSPRHTSPPDFFFFNTLINSLIFWLCWVFVSVQGLSPVAASGGHSSSRCAGLSLSRPLLLWGTGSRRAGSVIVAHGPSCSAACGIFPDQGSNPCPLYWQADSQPLRHQGSPPPRLFTLFLPVVSGLFSPAEQIGKLSLRGVSGPGSHSRQTDPNPGFSPSRTHVLTSWVAS